MSGYHDKPRMVPLFGVPIPYFSMEDVASAVWHHLAILNEQKVVASTLPVEKVRWGGIAAVAESLAGVCREQEAWIASSTEASAAAGHGAEASASADGSNTAPNGASKTARS